MPVKMSSVRLVVGALCGLSVVLCLGSATSCASTTALGGPRVSSQPRNVTVEDGAIYVRVISGEGSEAAAMLESLEAELAECRHLLKEAE